MNKKVALLSPNFEWKLFTLWYENSTLFGLAPKWPAPAPAILASLGASRLANARLLRPHGWRRKTAHQVT